MIQITRRTSIAGTILLTAALLGCPTFKTRHEIITEHKIEAHIVLEIRREAQAIEGEVRGPESQAPPTVKPVDTPIPPIAGFLDGRRVASLSLAGLVSRAPAQRDRDEAEAIARRKRRAPFVDRELTRGCFGEDNKGRVALRDCPEMERPSERQRLTKLAGEENADRRVIYLAVAKRAGLDASLVDEVGRIYAAEHRAKLKKGMWFQVPEEDAHYADFQKSPLGQKIGRAAKKAWIKVP